jgi:hypothetical protein
VTVTLLVSLGPATAGAARREAAAGAGQPPPAQLSYFDPIKLDDPDEGVHHHDLRHRQGPRRRNYTKARTTVITTRKPFMIYGNTF